MRYIQFCIISVLSRARRTSLSSRSRISLSLILPFPIRVNRFIETHRDDLREMLLREKAQLKETRHGQGVTELRETRERELHQELREERKRLRGGSHDAEDEDATAGDDADLPSDSHNSANTKTDKAAGVAPAAVKKAISEIFAARNKAKQHKAESVPGGREVKL